MSINPICIRIHELRTLKKLNQKEFASLLGVTNAYISRIEKGRTVPSDALIKLICMVYHVSEEWLRFGELPLDNVLLENKQNILDSTLPEEKDVKENIQNFLAEVPMIYLILSGFLMGFNLACVVLIVIKILFW